jgi:carboxypeptidase Q
MYNRLLTLILFGLLFTIFSFRLRQDKIEDIFTKINQEVLYRGKAYSALGEATSKIGHRLTGSTNGRKAEEFAFNFLKEAGFSDVRYMPFEVETWSRDTVSLSIAPSNSDNYRDVEVVALAHSPVSAHVTQQMVDCGDGLEGDFEEVKDRIKGKIALMNIGISLEKNKGQKNLHRSEKTALAMKYGAVGVIIANQVKGGVLLTGTASVTGALIDIPAVCISVESGAQIRKWMKDEPNANLMAVIDMRNFSRGIKARNVIATIKGSSRKLRHEKIVIGGHLDSWDLAQGATDNGIGSFSVLDIARTFKALKLSPKRSIEFVLFMGEEQGLLGSRAFIKKMKADNKLDQVALMMNLDMANNPMGFNAFGQDGLKAFFQQVGEKINKIDTTFTNSNFSQAGLHSDHQPFMLEGVPVCSPMGGLPIKTLNCYHASCDKFDLVDKKQMLNTVRFSTMMLYALADADAIPVKKMTSEETEAYLIKQKLKKELIIGKDWRWKE